MSQLHITRRTSVVLTKNYQSYHQSYHQTSWPSAREQ